MSGHILPAEEQEFTVSEGFLSSPGGSLERPRSLAVLWPLPLPGPAAVPLLTVSRAECWRAVG